MKEALYNSQEWDRLVRAARQMIVPKGKYRWGDNNDFRDPEPKDFGKSTWRIKVKKGKNKLKFLSKDDIYIGVIGFKIPQKHPLKKIEYSEISFKKEKKVIYQEYIEDKGGVIFSKDFCFVIYQGFGFEVTLFSKKDEDMFFSIEGTTSFFREDHNANKIIEEATRRRK